MVNLKKIILIAISGALLSVSGLIVYRNFVSTPSTTPPAHQSTVDSLRTSSNRIFPYGEDLDFGIVRKYNSQGQVFNYPRVNPDTDLGVPLSELIKKGASEDSQ